MALSKDEILDAIAEMSVMDIVALVEAMEEKFGVSARSGSSSSTCGRWRCRWRSAKSRLNLTSF